MVLSPQQKLDQVKAKIREEQRDHITEENPILAERSDSLGIRKQTFSCQ
jgi:hypothetical protein